MSEKEFTWDALDDLIDELREMEQKGLAYMTYDELALSWSEMRERIEAYVQTRLRAKEANPDG